MVLMYDQQMICKFQKNYALRKWWQFVRITAEGTFCLLQLYNISKYNYSPWSDIQYPLLIYLYLDDILIQLIILYAIYLQTFTWLTLGRYIIVCSRFKVYENDSRIAKLVDYFECIKKSLCPNYFFFTHIYGFIIWPN